MDASHVPEGRTLQDLLDYSDESDDDQYYMDVRVSKQGVTAVKNTATSSNLQSEPSSMARFQPAQHKHVDAKVMSRIHIDQFDSSNFGSGARKANDRVVADLYDATVNARDTKKSGLKDVDRSERATVENVLDPRTRLLLYKLVNSGILSEIHGCVSTGKEANVYYAVSGDGSPTAVKVFKTSILSFRDRDKYVSGEFRFQRYCKSNPRKMVRTWAEKEARNLIRLQEGCVMAPAVKLLRQHIILMEFLGEEGWPAPRLKDVQFPSLAALDQCYLDLCCTVRKMFIRSRLIHGDLSEFNLLLYRGRVVVIDVSQSVEQHHPLAMDFLRRDLVNITRFFRSKGHRDLFSLQELFSFVVTPGTERWGSWTRSVGPDNVEEVIAHLKEMREARETPAGMTDEQAEVDEQVFLNINVPRGLADFSDTKKPNAEWEPFLKRMTASSPAQGEEDHDENDEEHEEDEEGEEEEGEEGEEGCGRSRNNGGVRLNDLTRDEKKDHKKAVKEAQRLRREEKKAEKLKGKKKKKH